MYMKIIGLAGTNGSGKDTVAKLLRDEYGWLFSDSTDLFVAELTKRGLPTDRPHKADLSAEWRRQYGMAAVVDMGIKAFKAGEYPGLIVSSLRHPGEVDRVHELGGSVVWVDADPRVRYDRVTSNDRGRIEDRKTFEEFEADQAREMTPTGDGATLNMSAVKERADILIENNGSDIAAFCEAIRQQLAELLS